MSHAFFDSRVAADGTWQMTYGERFALEGLLSVLKPGLAVETGTAEGGSLRSIAAHAGEVHCFDIDPGIADVVAQVPTAHAHVGDSAQTLPSVLDRFAAEDRHVDFALVDGDHSAAGVRRDAQALLASPACRETTIVFHDAANDDVRAGLDGLDLSRHPKVALAVLDFVPGYVVADGTARAGESWNGLALVVLAPYAPDVAPSQTPARESVARIYRDWRASRAGA